MAATPTAPAKPAAPIREKNTTLIMGEAGTGKTLLASSWPPPLYVAHFDAPGKAKHYDRLGTPGPLKADPRGFNYREVTRNGVVVAHVEFFNEYNPRQPSAWQLFTARFDDFREDRRKNKWRTAILDSVTCMDIAARKDSEYRVNLDLKKRDRDFSGQIHYAHSTNELEEFLMMTLPAFSTVMDVVVITHISKKEDEAVGTVLRHAHAPGRLRTSVYSQYTEVYRLYAESTTDADGNRKVVRRLQTEVDDLFNCMSICLGAPNGLRNPTYAKLWTNYDARRNGTATNKE